MPPQINYKYIIYTAKMHSGFTQCPFFLKYKMSICSYRNSRRILSLSIADNIRNQHHLRNDQEIKFLKIFFYMLSCVFPSKKEQSRFQVWKTRILEHGTSFILVFYIVGDLINVISLASLLPKGLTMSSLASDFCTIAIRAILLLKSKKIFSTMKYLQKIHTKLPVKRCSSRKYYLLIGCCLSFIIPASFFVNTIELCSLENLLQTYVKEAFFGWCSQDIRINCIALTTMDFIILNQRYTLPGFAIVLSCYVFGLLRRVLESFEATLNRNDEFEVFYATYIKYSKKILSGVVQVEISLSLLLLLLYSYMTVEIFSVMSLLIRITVKSDRHLLIPFYVLMVVVCVAFYILSLRAIAVHDSAVRVKNSIYKRLAGSEHFCNEKQSTLLTMVADFSTRVVLTGWGFFDINRTFIQTTASTIFTYGIVLSQVDK